MFMLKPDSGRKDSKTGNLCWLCGQDIIYRCFSVIVELSPLPLLKFAILLSLISELMVTCLADGMVNIPNGRVGVENAQWNGNLPPPPSLAQTIASILEYRDEQTELLHQLVANSARGGNGAEGTCMTTASCSTTWHSMRRIKWTWTTRGRTTLWLVSPPSCRSAWRSTLDEYSQSLSTTSSSWTMQSALTRKPRRGRLW
jgi:hypothetical protein